MNDRPLVEWSAIYDAPPELLRRLRAIRPNVELLYQGEGRWMLGEVRWNWEKYRRGVAIIAQFLHNRHKEGVAVLSDPRHRRFLEEGLLLMQGFTWIRDYEGPPDGRIEIDYARMCWKEDHGLLDADFRQMLKESDSATSLLRRQKIMQDRLHSEGKSDWAIINKHRKSVTLSVPPKPNLLVPRANRQRIVTL
jgi:hypothetical protein